MALYVGKAPLTTIQLQDGRRANLHAGSVAPAAIDPDDAERLVREGFIEVLDVEEEAEPDTSAGADSDLATQLEAANARIAELEAAQSPADSTAPTGDDDGGDGGDEAKPPAKSASKADWVAYATDEARGDKQVSAEDADKATRDQLAEMFS